MRLFVAFTLPAGALAELEAAVARLRPDWPGLRWTGPDRWHVTVAFLGEVAESRLDRLAPRLARAAGRHAPQQVRVGSAGAFPAASRARVLWAGIEGGPDAMTGLSALAVSVAAGARRAGAPSPDEGRRYRPHLTLARTRRPEDLGPLVAELAGFSGSPFAADRIELIESRLAGDQAYVTIDSWPLTGTPAAERARRRRTRQRPESSTRSAPGTSRIDRAAGPT
ncbi:MAG: RNA 2',3'-cyclic phosphodiesterase [Streptosporangiaceae bacterium]